MQRFFTSESVSQGHPDKVCDQISDAILDAMLTQDPESRVACETLVTTGLVVIAGEITSKAVVDLQSIVRKTISEIGYNDPALGFDANSCGVLISVHQQSTDISQGVTEGQGLHAEQGAGDQGIMFGYASNETSVYMPQAIHYAHRLVEELTCAREEGSPICDRMPNHRSPWNTTILHRHESTPSSCRHSTVRMYHTKHSNVR